MTSAGASDEITLVVAHDAGGAEVVSSYLRRHPGKYAYALGGPAVKIFERKLGAIDNLPLDAAVEQCDRLLCGTSWQSDLEVDAIGLCRARGKPSAAFLDHWVNYRERFTRNGIVTLPDAIWVGDASARTLAAEKFPGTPLTLIDNPYFADLRAELAALPQGLSGKTGGLRILYVCEPVREHALLRFGDARHWGYTEEEALHYFLDHVGALGGPLAAIVIRPHPSEARDKYHALAAGYDLPIAFSQGAALYEEIAASDCVAGCSSMAMVVALIAGKRVVSTIPPGGHPCALPQPEIEHLQTLLAAKT